MVTTLRKLALLAALAGAAFAQYIPPGGGGSGSGSVTGVTVAGTSNQITATGTCSSSTVVSCTFSIPSGFVLPGTINGLTITTTTGTITITNGKTVTVQKSLNFDGTDSTTLTFPTTSATIARTDAAQTFTGVQTFSSSPIIPTLSPGDNSTKAASTAFVTAAVTGGSGAAGQSVTTTYSATPTFTASSNTLTTFLITLTGNVTSSTLAGASSGQDLTFRICQDGSGAHTFVFPTNVFGYGTIDTTANLCSNQDFRYDGTNANAIGNMYVTGTTGGSITLPGSSSGSTILQPTAAASGTLTLPAATDTLMGRNTVDTVTNKSIAASEINSGTLAVAQGGTNLASGTSGGVLGYTASGTIASSAALTANLPVIGGGAGATPTSGSRTGNTTQYASWTGATTAARCVDTDASGNLQITAADCGTGTGGGAGSTLFSTTASTAVTAAAATTLIGSVTGSTTVAANTFTAGAVLQFQAQGFYTGSSGRTLTIDLKMGGTTRLTTGAVSIPIATNGTWRLACNITTRTAGVSGTQIGNCMFEATGATLTAPGEAPMQTASTWSVDTTGTQAIDLQATWDSTSGSPTITATNVAAWIPGAPVSSVQTATGAVTLFNAINKTNTYQVLAADFVSTKTITASSGTFTITLVDVATQPPDGQSVRFMNYGSGVITVARSGQNINGAASNITLAAGSASAPTGVLITSNGTDYLAQPLGASSGGGGVSSVAITAPSQMSVAGSPITTSGTLALSYPSLPSATAITYTADVNAPYVQVANIRRMSYMIANGGAARNNVGENATNTGSPGVVAPSATAPVTESIPTANGSAVGTISTLNHRTGRTNGMQLFCGAGLTATTNILRFIPCGVTSTTSLANALSADVPATGANMAYIVSSTTASYTGGTGAANTYAICTLDASVQNCTTIGVAISANTFLKFMIYEDVSNSRWIGCVNATCAASTTHNPVSGTNMTVFSGMWGNGTGSAWIFGNLQVFDDLF